MDRIKGMPTWFTRPRPLSAAETPAAGAGGAAGGGGVARGVRGVRGAGGFIEKNLLAAASYARGLTEHEGFAARNGLLQGIDPRVRIVGVAALVASAALASRTVVLVGMLAMALAIGWLSRIGPRAIAARALPAVLLTAVLVVPVLTGFVSPGEPLLAGSVAGVEITVTGEGVSTAAFFLLRVTAMVSLVMLLVLSTRQADLFRGLGGLPIPALFTTTLFVTFRYVFVLLKISGDAQLARKSRTIGGAGAADDRRWFASRMAVLLRRSVATAGDVTLAMASRGFAGRVRTFPARPLGSRDLACVGFVSFVFLFSLAL